MNELKKVISPEIFSIFVNGEVSHEMLSFLINKHSTLVSLTFGKKVKGIYLEPLEQNFVFNIINIKFFKRENITKIIFNIKDVFKKNMYLPEIFINELKKIFKKDFLFYNKYTLNDYINYNGKNDYLTYIQYILYNITIDKNYYYLFLQGIKKAPPLFNKFIIDEIIKSLKLKFKIYDNEEQKTIINTIAPQLKIILLKNLFIN